MNYECAKCGIAITRCAYGWRHQPGPGKTTPNPGHEIRPVARGTMAKAGAEAVRNLRGPR